ncbi:hypothetical protein [Paenibacillus nasutitermitis]|uniref:Uncharacterized protein n=1 Tax=Paenibacillus nasutitermitis TaxID=1652958 RepID=A0A916Z243_9BACL|nr:hypothetical protein [Paenibacillus nasutitermitis]GGD73129.1 hypothetical protein GCM10010911_33730 [Paenibacillus nasutitermitis]
MHRFFYRLVAILLVMLVFNCAADPWHSASAAKIQSHNNQITLVVRSSPEAAFDNRIVISNNEIAEAIRSAKKEDSAFTPSLTDTYVILQETQTAYRLELAGNLWSESESKRLVLPAQLSARLRREAESLRNRHYGEYVTWEKAEKIAPRKSIFALQDLETGLTFRVQRRAGSRHADVQPLTKEDTKIMKQIYEDHWSWKRRAVLVHINGRKLAASMNGMPHGGDGIPGNGFSGHFCVHFQGSTTHRSTSPDMAHQLLVRKAAGNQKAFFDNASPLLLAQSIIEAINLKDSEMFRSITEGMEQDKYMRITSKMNSIDAIRMLTTSKTDPDENLLDAAVELKAAFREKERARPHSSFQFIFSRLSPYSPWRIEDLFIT